MSKFLQFFGSRSSFLRKNGQNSIKFLSTDLTDEKTLKMMRKLKIGATIVGVICGGASIFGYYLEKTICKASDLVVHPLEVPFFHKQSIWHGYDVKAVRRGYQVYKQVCQACHSVMIYEYRHFVNQIMTEDEARAEAAEMTVEDGPNDNGEYFTRPGKLTDPLPKPYKTETHAKLANNMAIPPDLMLITLARHGGEDYLFHLLTGYQEAPAGIELGPGQAYNPYFPNGSVLSMAQQLYDDMLEYEDGTPATQSQMAKDVSTFLTYLARPEMPDFKRYALKDYLFHLLTGYQEAPAGIELGPGQAYNPYFPNGSVLSMAQQLYDDMLEYEDGTPATQSQMAKDVSTFLTYLARPEMPDFKRYALKDYLFHLLTGYQEAPAGIELGPGQAYNPYFPNGSVLSMAQQLYDDMLEYEDGTPATQSQMAKDVSTFLTYLARPEMPNFKRYALKLAFMSLPVGFVLLYLKRFIWTTWKSQKVVFRPVKGREEWRAPRR